jgi:serine/threonine protein kinase
MGKTNMNDPDSHSSALRPAAERIARMCDAFKEAWRAHEKPTIEDFLWQVEDSMGDDLMCELIALEVDLRRESGETVLPQEYLARFPGKRAIVERAFAIAPEQLAAHGQVPTDPTALQPFPGEFHFCELLGRGRFGKVWLAHDLCMGRLVAVKTIKATDSSEREKQLTLLRREANLVGGCKHPNIVTFYAWRQVNGECYLFMEYVPGGSLRNRLQREQAGKLKWPTAVQYVVDVAEGLAELHKKGIFHRDIKPENVLWHSERDNALLTDFGVSARLSQNDAAGTPKYMAPEAFDGIVSPAVDVYSLTVTLFVLLTGEVPFSADTVSELLVRVKRGLPSPDSRLVDIPEELQKVIRAGLSADPKSRPKLSSFIEQVRGALNRLLADTLTSIPRESNESPNGGLELRVSRRITDGNFQEIVATRAVRERKTRDMKPLPPAPDRAVLKNGDVVRIEAVAGCSGHLYIFNIGPSGNLNMLRPRSSQQPSAVAGGSAVHVCEVEIVPPAGTERLLGVWTSEALSLDQLTSIAETQGESTSRPYRATRDMKALDSSLRESTDCEVAVLELEHVE